MARSKAKGYYVDRANGYIEAVLNGTIPACKWVRLACERQKRDLSRQKDEDWLFRFDVEKAERVCRFAELLPHVAGDDANAKRYLVLEPWQCFVLTTLFGWVYKHSGFRRFKFAYTEIPRKNGKSFLSTAVGLYMLCADREQGAQVVSAATKRDQAMHVWTPASLIVQRSKDLRSALGVDSNSRAIFQLSTGSTFKPMARVTGGSEDGGNIHCAIVDELHAHRTSEMWDVLVSGIGARSQPLVWAITTAGFDRTGVCYDRRTYLTKVLEQVFTDESLFGLIYTIDEEDDWKDPEVWKKANPNWGVSVKTASFEALANEAINSVTRRNNFLTKCLNRWVSSQSAWIDMTAFDKCADPDLDEQDFAGERCYIGADLAVRIDIASIARLYVREKEDENKVMRRHYYAFFDHHIPEATILNSSNDRYQTWDMQGLFTVSEGSSIDLNFVEQTIREHARDKNVVDVCFDGWNAQQMIQNLTKDRLPLVEMRPNVANLSDPMKELESAVLDGRFHYNGDPIFQWMMSNVTVKQDARGNLYPRKERAENKIDGVFALLMAMARASVAVPAKPSKRVFFS